MTRDVQINAPVRTAAMSFFFDFLATRGEFIDIRSWSPVSWESMNLGEAHSVVLRAVGTGGTGHACCVGTLVIVCSPAEAGGLINVADGGSRRAIFVALEAIGLRGFS